jgi:hypothetical protein
MRVFPKSFSSIALFFILLILNAFLISPYIGWYDSGEMVGVTQCLGISHPSGQVLFHLLGKIFLLLPFETPAFRLGLLSVACSALAAVLFRILIGKVALAFSGAKVLSADLERWLFLLTLIWSLSLPWWRYSVMPLVYALHLLLGFLTLWALSLEKPFKWLLVFFILGVATVFRPTQFFALPFVGLVFLFDWRRKKRGIKPLLFSLVAFGLGRSVAIYLPLRSALHPEIAYADLTHPVVFFKHLFALGFSNYIGAVNPSAVLSLCWQMIRHFWTDLTPLIPVGFFLLVFGFSFLPLVWKRLPVFLWVGLGWGVVEALFVFTVPFPVLQTHQVLLGWAFSGLLAALALAGLESWAGKNRYLKVASTTVLIAMVLTQFLSLGHLLERKKERGAQDYARNILEIMESDALFFPTEENEYFPVVGYQQSFGFKKSVEVIQPGRDPSSVSPRIKECLRQNRPLYVTRKWDLPPGWFYQVMGPLLRVVGETSDTIVPMSKIQPQVSWGKIGLVQVRMDSRQVEAGGRITLAYHWTRGGPSPFDQNGSVVALFADDHGNFWMKDGVFWLHDIHEGPLDSFSRLKPWKECVEQRVLFIPSDFPPGRYHLMVGLQKKVPPRKTGREAFDRGFYERSGYQNLGKFLGRGENGAQVQFSNLSGPSGDDLWPVTQSLEPLADPRFAPVADLEILPAD